MAGVILVAVACSSKKQPPVAAHSPLADSADQVMYGASFILTDNGIPARPRCRATPLYFFEDNTRIEPENRSHHVFHGDRSEGCGADVASRNFEYADQ